ncbi:hypothetical protein [Streptomyces olivaceoviridis]
MDPISAELLVAMATGAAGEAGRHLWAALTGLVRSSPDRQADEPEAPAVAAGQEELVALNAAPHDTALARLLSQALDRRAQQDRSFRTNLEQWRLRAQALRTGDGETRNEISGGAQNGPVFQGRDFSAITFNGPDER